MKIRITGLPKNKKTPSLYGFGGNLGTNGSDFTDGLTYFNVPTRHETNPNGGIPLGMAPDGQPNLVEGKEESKKGDGGEIKWNSLDYIFSDRLTPSKEFIKKWKLPERFLDYTYADVIRKSPVIKEAEERPNHPDSLGTVDRFLADAAEDQELTKKQKEAAKMLEQLSQMSDDELMALGALMSQEDKLRRQLEMEQLTQQPDDYANLALNAQLENIQSAALMNDMAQQQGMVQPLMMGAEGGTFNTVNDARYIPFYTFGKGGYKLKKSYKPLDLNTKEGQQRLVEYLVTNPNSGIMDAWFNFMPKPSDFEEDVLAQLYNEELQRLIEKNREEIKPYNLHNFPTDRDALNALFRLNSFLSDKFKSLKDLYNGTPTPNTTGGAGYIPFNTYAEGGQPEVIEQMPLEMPLEQLPMMNMEPQLEVMQQPMPQEAPQLPQQVELTPQRKPAEEMSTRELNEALDEIIEYARENKDKQLLREAKKVKRSGTREEKEAFVDDTFEEIEMEQLELAEAEAATQELQTPQEVPLELPAMMAEGGEMPTEEPQPDTSMELPQQSQDGERLIQQLLQIGDQLGYGKDSEYTPQEVEDLLNKASQDGIDVSSLQSQSNEELAAMLTLLLKQVNNLQEVVQPEAPEAPLDNLFKRGGGLDDGREFNLSDNVNDNVPYTYTVNNISLETPKRERKLHNGISNLRHKLNGETAEPVVTVNEGDTKAQLEQLIIDKNKDGIPIQETVVIGYRPRRLLSPQLFAAQFPLDDEDVFARTRALIESTGKKPSEITSRELAKKAVEEEERRRINKALEIRKAYLQLLLGNDYPVANYIADGGPIFAQGGSMSFNNEEGNHIFAGKSVVPEISWNNLHPLQKKILEKYGLNSASTNEEIIDTLKNNPLIREELVGIKGDLIFIDNKGVIDRFMIRAGQEPIYYRTSVKADERKPATTSSSEDDGGSSWSARHSNEDDGPKEYEEKVTPKMRKWARKEGIEFEDDADLITKWNEHQSAIQRWGKTYENLSKEDLEIARSLVDIDVTAENLQQNIARQKTENFLKLNAPGYRVAEELQKYPEDLFSLNKPNNWNYATNGDYIEGGWDFSTLYGNDGDIIMRSTDLMGNPVHSNGNETIGVTYNGYNDYAAEHGEKYRYNGEDVSKEKLRELTQASKDAFIKQVNEDIKNGNGSTPALNMLWRLGAGTTKGAKNLYFDDNGNIRSNWEKLYRKHSTSGVVAQNHGWFKENPEHRNVYRIKNEKGEWQEVYGDPSRYNAYYAVNKNDAESNDKVTIYDLTPNSTNRNLVKIDGVTYDLGTDVNPDVFKKVGNPETTTLGYGVTNTDLYYDPIYGTNPVKPKDENANIYKPYPFTSLLKYAPFFNFPYLEDYSSYNEMANALNGIKYIDAPDHREYLKYTPADLLYRMNQAQMMGIAANRGIAGLANRNQGTLMANLALQNAKNREALGEIGINTEKENWERNKDVVTQHNQVDLAADQLQLEADKANMSNNPLIVDARQKAANQGYLITKGNNESKSAWQADMLGLLNKQAMNDEQWYWYDRFLNSGANEPGANVLGRGVATPPYRRSSEDKNGGSLTIRRKRRNRLS